MLVWGMVIRLSILLKERTVSMDYNVIVKDRRGVSFVRIIRMKLQLSRRGDRALIAARLMVKNKYEARRRDEVDIDSCRSLIVFYRDR